MTEFTFTFTQESYREEWFPVIINDCPYWFPKRNFQRQLKIVQWFYAEELKQEAMRQLGLKEVKPNNDKPVYVS